MERDISHHSMNTIPLGLYCHGPISVVSLIPYFRIVKFVTIIGKIDDIHR